MSVPRKSSGAFTLLEPLFTPNILIRLEPTLLDQAGLLRDLRFDATDFVAVRVKFRRSSSSGVGMTGDACFYPGYDEYSRGIGRTSLATRRSESIRINGVDLNQARGTFGTA